MEIDISRLPYKHRFAAASMLMSKGNRLTDLASGVLTDFASGVTDEKQVQRVLQGLSFYDMALSLMKPHDPNYQTLLNWKCLALISLGQYEDARRWYEELVRIAAESEGANRLGATARLALDQIASLTGKQNAPLPEIDRLDVRVFDDPPFCEWAEQFCRLLQDRKFKQAHRWLSPELRATTTPAGLKSAWTKMLGSSRAVTTISLERYELAPEPGDEGHVGWCYFSVTDGEVSEAISLDVHNPDKSAQYAFEIGSLEFGRP